MRLEEKKSLDIISSFDEEARTSTDLQDDITLWKISRAYLYWLSMRLIQVGVTLILKK